MDIGEGKPEVSLTARLDAMLHIEVIFVKDPIEIGFQVALRDSFLWDKSGPGFLRDRFHLTVPVLPFRGHG